MEDPPELRFWKKHSANVSRHNRMDVAEMRALPGGGEMEQVLGAEERKSQHRLQTGGVYFFLIRALARYLGCLSWRICCIIFISILVESSKCEWKAVANSFREKLLQIASDKILFIYFSNGNSCLQGIVQNLLNELFLKYCTYKRIGL